MSDLEQCGHGIPYKGADCLECEKVWAQHVTLPNARKTVATLLKFYDEKTLIGLIFAQDHHIEKLQGSASRNPDRTHGSDGVAKQINEILSTRTTPRA